MTRGGVLLLCLSLGATAAQERVTDAAVRAVLTSQLGFSDRELADISRGEVVKHSLRPLASTEVAVAGAVRIRTAKTAFFDRARDIAKFKNGPDVVQIGRFSHPPGLADLAALTIDEDDFDVRSCRVGDCGIRLPATVIERIGREIDAKARDAQAHGAALLKQFLVDEVSAYMAGADRLTQYDDGPQPIRPRDEFENILTGMPEIAALMPGLPDHLRRFTTAPLPDAEDFLYWSKEKFGIAPFISVTHVTIVCPSAATCLMTTRDVYASRYLDASIALAIATDAGGHQAFDLVYDNRSRANALKGRFSALRRSLTERRARGALEDSLTTIKRRLEPE